MGVDLTYRGAFETTGILIREDHLMVMRNKGGSDRLRRIKLTRIKQVSFHRYTRWFTVLSCALLLVLAGALSFTGSYIATLIIGGPTLAALVWTLYQGGTQIQIIRDGVIETLKTTSTRGRVEHFRSRLDTAIRECQRRGWAEWDANETGPSS